jgi:thiol-disulfide isomerase/thioredoxin
LLLLSLYVNAQAGRVYPAHPVVGDTIRISYHQRDAAAVLTGTALVFAKVTAYGQEGGYRWHNLPLSGKDSLQAFFVVPPATASLAIRFYTLNKDDEEAGKKLAVYNPNRQLPVAGARFEDFFSNNADSFFKQEIEQYPQHYLAYAKYFNVASMMKGAEESKALITSLLQPLEKVYQQQKDTSAGLLAALCVGYAKSGRLSQAKPILFRLFAVFPTQEETALAFSLYNYEYYKATSKQIENDVRQQLAFIFKQWSNAALNNDTNVTYYLQGDSSLTVADFEQVLLPRYAQGTVPYYGLDLLPGIYIDRRAKLDSARAMLLRTVRLFQDGSIQHHYRLSPTQYSLYVPFLLQRLAAADLLLQDYEAAVIHASAAIALIAGSNTEGNFLPDLLTIRASAYRRSDNLNMALEDYQRLYASGKETLLDSIKAIFPDCTVKEKSVEALVAALQKKPVTTASDKVAAMPDFTGKDLQGRAVKLSALKGKIVVINFWGTGCGPCIGEMPELNRLVKKYHDNKEVVFLAITGDDTERLKQFFKKRTFLYTIVNKAGAVSNAYDIQSLPVHIVIGKNGEALNRSIGARADIFEFLDKVISRSL